MIAPGYTPEALAILSKKKGGNFIILEGDIDYVSPDIEYREVAGAVFAQQRNKQAFGPEHCEKIVTKRTELPESAVRDIVVASIACKYTQSNSTRSTARPWAWAPASSRVWTASSSPGARWTRGSSGSTRR